MVKMVSLRKTKADRQAEDRATESRVQSYAPDGDGDGDDHGGPEVHLDLAHLKKMGAHEAELPAGHEIHFKGRVISHTLGHENGEATGHARVRLVEAGTELPEEAPRAGLRADLEKSHGDSERKSAERAEKRGAAKARADEKELETKGAKD